MHAVQAILVNPWRQWRTVARLGAGLAIILVVALRPAPSLASTVVFHVNTTADAPDVHPGDGVCAAASGLCTLRAAGQEASALGGSPTVTILAPGGTYTLTLGPIVLSANTITVQGNESASQIRTVISGNHAGRIFEVTSTVTLDELTLVAGLVQHVSGGAILNSGTLFLNHDVFQGNHADLFGFGGALSNTGMLVANDDLFTDNRASVYGGAIYNSGSLEASNLTLTANRTSLTGSALDSESPGVVLLDDSQITDNAGGAAIRSMGTTTIRETTIARNGLGASGGNIAGGVEGAGTMRISDSLFQDNVGSLTGGLEFSTGSVVVRHSTFTGNSGHFVGALSVGSTQTDQADISNSTFYRNTSSYPCGFSCECLGAVTNFGTAHLSFDTLAGDTCELASARGAQTFVKGTILAGSGAAPSCQPHGLSTSLGFNLDLDGSCAFHQPSDLVGQDPRLGPLADNGGTTPTLALLTGSPAIDAANTRGCPPTDQRGVPRPQGPACDIGAFELQE